ncbi:DNA-binding MarR family transcriptional regulator [Labedaea rhizosphaerae]|uniref:DNA-binding MarR family transcriptional regulator n=2 Tax=Labedaea rhizosphaerae TaxID=598644 RepID=A0A4V3D0D9_LABRH|nr:DNA-binding MarR family transcriptional regulator [Labedaea rhizosphaerae]
MCQDVGMLDDLELVFLLGHGYNALLGEFVRRLDAAGYGDLRPAHGFVFQALWGPGKTASELAEHLGVTKQAAGQLVDELERRGYVKRVAHPAGGRRRLVVLTEAAERHLRVAGETLHQLERELAEAIPLGELREGLVTLVRTLSGDHLPPLRPIW